MKTKPFTQMLVGHTIGFKGPAGSFDALVLSETKGTLRVQVPAGQRTLLKSSYTLRVGDVIVEGARICRRPHDRLKGA